MRISGRRRWPAAPAVILLGAATAGCGWSPPSPPATSSTPAAQCGPGPAAADVEAEFALLPPGPWRETSRGAAADCRLRWVIVSEGDEPDSLQQALFFDGASPVGSPTMDPRPYISVTAAGEHDAVVQYQWRQGSDEPCCPTGIGTARVTIEDGRLTVLDPIPNG